MERDLYFTVSPSDEGRLLRDVVRSRWNVSSALWIRLKRTVGAIAVNGEAATARTECRAGDTVRLRIADECDSDPEATEMPLEILYEDADLIAVNKPPFTAVHPSKGHGSDTLANGLAFYYRTRGDKFVFRCVTRLDRNTSGVVLIAKNAYAHDVLRRELARGTVYKEYSALVHGEPPYSFECSAPISDPNEATIKRRVDPGGKEAKTLFRLEKTDGKLSLLRAIPYTGRTHQIRLHCAECGYPIVSDFLYGEEHDGVLSRHGLHCSELRFPHPVTGKKIRIRAPLAADMARVCDRLIPIGRYRSADFEWKLRFGRKMRKIPIDAGFSCPNRDGRVGIGGCAFCAANGSAAPVPSVVGSVSDQLRRGKERLLHPSEGAIAYFQAYTNTDAPPDRLRKIYRPALEDPEISALSIATRPDCCGEDVLDLLGECAKIKPIFVELGLQTANDALALRLNRGYETARFVEAARALRERRIPVITHLIFGLPGQTGEDAIESVRFAGKRSDGVKIQMLQILKTSALGREYERSPFPLLGEEEYANLVCDAIAVLPRNVTVHRLTGDPAKELLIAPLWCADKKSVRARIDRLLCERNIFQGIDSDSADSTRNTDF